MTEVRVTDPAPGLAAKDSGQQAVSSDPRDSGQQAVIRPQGVCCFFTVQFFMRISFKAHTCVKAHTQPQNTGNFL